MWLVAVVLPADDDEIVRGAVGDAALAFAADTFDVVVVVEAAVVDLPAVSMFIPEPFPPTGLVLETLDPPPLVLAKSFSIFLPTDDLFSMLLSLTMEVLFSPILFK